MTLEPVLAATEWKSNAHLIEDVARLGHIKTKDATIDVTYGRGVWWKRWKPAHLEALSREISPEHDFRSMPAIADNAFDVVAYDPPYVCVSLDTEILTLRGWLSWAEARVGDLAYTLNHETGGGEWHPLEAVHVLPAARRKMLSIEGSAHSSLTTGEHRWPVVDRHGRRGWSTSASFKSDDCVPIRAPWTRTPTATHSDSLVELVAWFWTEGHIEGGLAGATGRGGYGNISQSHKVNSDNCRRIDKCLTDVFGPPVEHFPRLGAKTDGVPRWRLALDGDKDVFWLSADAGRYLLAFAPDLIPSTEFLLSLSSAQLHIFVNTSLDADGFRNSRGVKTLAQKVDAMAEAFALAALLAGFGVSFTQSTEGACLVRLRKRATFKPSRNTRTWVDHDDPVWCVTTNNETWLARRHGKVYFTGNCRGGRGTTNFDSMNEHYGLIDAPRTPALLQILINEGMDECYRILKPARTKKAGGVMLVKTMDAISGGDLAPSTFNTYNHAVQVLGMTLVDRFLHITKPRPQDDRPQGHARNNVSTLFVFRKGPL